jgi:hypothetical protein
MGAFKIIYRISLSEQQDADAFETFLRDRYLPAVHKGPTRTGQVTSLALLRGVADTHAPTHTFMIHLGFDGLASGGLRIDDEDAQRDFDAYGAPLERLGAFGEYVILD